MLSGTAPSSISFSTVNVATLPEPDTSTRLPSIVSSLAFSISQASPSAEAPAPATEGDAAAEDEDEEEEEEEVEETE